MIRIRPDQATEVIAMVNATEEIVAECGCNPFAPTSEGDVCGTCSPKLALSVEEEAVLGQMRALKERVRPIADRMKQLREDLAGSVDGDRTGLQSEWGELSGQLDVLRSQWKEWEFKLDEAIHRKLVMLGHREA
jgi:hypothetical protein